MIANDKKNPDAWIEYAIFLLRIKDVDRAIACCREAIALDKRHKIALVNFYPTLIAYEKEIKIMIIYFNFNPTIKLID